VRPDRVICLAGIAGKPDISWCETNQVETIRVNLIGQLNVIDVASSKPINGNAIHCTLITTGGIYTYDNDKHKISDSNGAFTELDEPNFVNKLFYYDLRILQEKLLKSYESSSNVLALRIMYPSTRDLVCPKNMLAKLIKYKQIKSVPISISILDDLFPIMVDMVAKRVQGTFNFNNPGTISHEQILELYKTHVDPSHSWATVKYDASRPAAELSVQKLLSLGYSIPTVYESIKSIMVAHKASKSSSVVDLDSICLKNINLARANPQFKNIMITGGAGFIASHVAILLCQKYKHLYNIFVYDILDSCSNIKNLDAIKNEINFKFIKGDIGDFNMAKFVMEEFKIDCVMHFAAQSHVDISLKNSLKFTEANVMGTHVLLEAARQIGMRKFNFIEKNGSI
jgi:nucleoside-diphosphate-sugar epimerase